MPKFEIGDRVAYRENLATVGTVKRIVNETDAGARVYVAWDYGVGAEIDDSELVADRNSPLG